MAGGVCAEDSASGSPQWVPDEIHLAVSLKCGAELPVRSPVPPPAQGDYPHTPSLCSLSRGFMRPK